MQSIFKRYEKKYLITREQCAALQGILRRRMSPDRYGEYLVQNLYFDTDNWDIIRTSVEKPLYKEKMRMRCYGAPCEGSRVFLELKKKYDGIVYKRRVAFPLSDLLDGTVDGVLRQNSCQIARELAFHLGANGVSEKIYISCRRLAFTGIEDEGLRVTFDTDVRFRLANLDFAHPGSGRAILSADDVIMEIKTLGGMPLWLAGALSENSLFPTSFSKVGCCYTDFVLRPQNLLAV